MWGTRKGDHNFDNHPFKSKSNKDVLLFGSSGLLMCGRGKNAERHIPAGQEKGVVCVGRFHGCGSTGLMMQDQSRVS